MYKDITFLSFCKHRFVTEWHVPQMTIVKKGLVYTYLLTDFFLTEIKTLQSCNSIESTIIDSFYQFSQLSIRRPISFYLVVTQPSAYGIITRNIVSHVKSRRLKMI